MSKASYYKSMFVLTFLSLGLAFGYQNCSNVGLTQQASTVIWTGNVQLDYCFSGSLASYTIDTAFVKNVNLTRRQGVLAIDTDADGLTDDEEAMYGFDPLNRRSKSTILDGACFSFAGTSSCTPYIPACTGTMTPMGFTDCDLNSLQLSLANSVQGLDSDQDGVPDLLEYLGGTLPNIADALSDPDHDGVINRDEIAKGTNPTFADNGAVSLREQTQTSLQQVNAGSCSGEHWQLKSSFPFVPMPAYTDPNTTPGTLNFSHARDESLVIVFLKVKSPGANSFLLYKPLLVNQTSGTFSLSESDMINAGQIAP